MQMAHPPRLLGVEKLKQDIDRADHAARVATPLPQRNRRVANHPTSFHGWGHCRPATAFPVIYKTSHCFHLHQRAALATTHL